MCNPENICLCPFLLTRPPELSAMAEKNSGAGVFGFCLDYSPIFLRLGYSLALKYASSLRPISFISEL